MTLNDNLEINGRSMIAILPIPVRRQPVRADATALAHQGRRRQHGGRGCADRVTRSLRDALGVFPDIALDGFPTLTRKNPYQWNSTHP
jgi:hypothetical protein